MTRHLGTATPEDLWDRLSETVKARITLRAGTILEWWASANMDRRPAATVLGTDALIITEPTVDGNGALANRITAIPLISESFRRARHRAPSARPPSSGRRSEHIDVLRDFPPAVRDLIQDPFRGRPPESLRRDQYYAPGPLGPEGVTVRAWYYITDQQSLIFAAALGQGFRDGIGADSWDVTCWRADVRRSATTAV